jgi:hypothetical protein
MHVRSGRVDTFDFIRTVHWSAVSMETITHGQHTIAVPQRVRETVEFSLVEHVLTHADVL